MPAAFMQLGAGRDSARESVEEPPEDNFRDSRQDSSLQTPSVCSVTLGRMQEDCFQEALAAVSVMGDVNSDPTPSMSHAEEYVLRAVEEVQGGGEMTQAVDTLSELPVPSQTPAAQHAPSPKMLPADAASTGPPAPFRRQPTFQNTPNGVSLRRQSSSQTLGQRGWAKRCGGEIWRVAGALWHELNILKLLLPSVLASCGHSEAARWRLWLVRPFYALVCSRLLCVILFALARAPCVLDRAPLGT
ncbi:hypothetical protein T492DRAFT_229019 [Pavlovales sp. CCMP2436]|nr:hypothetical protein T492DRAFT_229019 [Pavlovales sp. CCMP2436]